MEAIKLGPKTQYVHEVRAFAGIINYYGQFILKICLV